MPRPTPAQLAYGTTTVLLSTLAMLLLSDARSGIGVALVAVVGLALGTFVAVTAPAPRRVPMRERSLETVVTMTGSGAEPRARVREHSLRR